MLSSVPAIIDPNTGITLWESGAIIQYLVENYDKEQKLSFSSTPEKYFANQWLMFQVSSPRPLPDTATWLTSGEVSGQGPYFGQGAWFGNFHAEDVPSAKKRYQEEIVRVTKVLDGWLKNHTYLVGDKCCYADLSFVTWYWLLEFITKTPSFEEQLKKDYPNWKRWIEALEARPAVKKVYEARNAKIAASH